MTSDENLARTLSKASDGITQGTMLRHLICILILCLALFGVAQAAPSLAIVLSEGSDAYAAFAEALKAELGHEAPTLEIRMIDLRQASQSAPANVTEATMTVAVGSKAAEVSAARDSRAPLLLALLPRAAVDRIRASRRDDRRLSAVYIDQPPGRYVDLVRLALPDYDRIGMMTGKDGGESTSRLAQNALEKRLKPMVEQITSGHDIYPAMQKMFADNRGVLLATPDATVFNAQTIPAVLLSAFQRRVPVVGFSPAYIKAGAVIALYSTPAQLATQTAEIVRSVMAGQALPQPQYPRYFSVGINSYVARALDLQLERESVLQDKLERLERAP